MLFRFPDIVAHKLTQLQVQAAVYYSSLRGPDKPWRRQHSTCLASQYSLQELVLDGSVDIGLGMDIAQSSCQAQCHVMRVSECCRASH